MHSRFKNRTNGGSKPWRVLEIKKIQTSLTIKDIDDVKLILMKYYSYDFPRFTGEKVKMGVANSRNIH